MSVLKILETAGRTKETELGVMNSKRKERKKSLKSCVNKSCQVRFINLKQKVDKLKKTWKS